MHDMRVVVDDVKSSASDKRACTIRGWEKEREQ